MPRSSVAKELIQLTALPSEDALTILYSLVELVADKSQFSTTSAKLKLLSTHKAVWNKACTRFGNFILHGYVTYTYSYLFNQSLIAMAEEVISERTKEVSIVVIEPDSVSIQLTPVPKKKKSSEVRC